MLEGAYRAYIQNQMDYYPFGMMKQPEVKDSVDACDGYRRYNPGACGLAPMGNWNPNESCCQDINVNMVQLVLPAGRYRIRFGATLNSNQYIAIRNKQTDVDFFTYTNSGNISAIIELEQSITVQIRCDSDGQGAMQICNLNVEVYDPNYCATLANGNASGICPVLAEGFVDNGLEPVGWTFDLFRVKDICAPGIQLDLKGGAKAIRHLPTIIGATYQVQWKICEGRDGDIRLTSGSVDTSFFASTFPISATQTFVATDTLTNIRILGEAQLAIDSLVVTKVCPILAGMNTAYRYRYNGKDSMGLLGGRYDYGFRMYDAGIGRFLTVDPLTKKYPELTPYQFASNRPIDGVDLDGAEWENFMSSFKDLTKLRIKLPSAETAQLQSYSVSASSSQVTPSQFASTISNDPNKILGNSKASFSFAHRQKEGTLSKGDILAISISGVPGFASHVKVNEVITYHDNEFDYFSLSLITLEGHVEAGAINFEFRQNKKSGQFGFSINSVSSVDYGLATIHSFPESEARDKQAESWKEVLDKVAGMTGEERKNIKIESSSVPLKPTK